MVKTVFLDEAIIKYLPKLHSTIAVMSYRMIQNTAVGSN